MNEATHISLVRLFNAIKDAVNEMDRCPEDSIQDIWNEMLDKWETGLRMDRKYNIEPNTERSACGTPSAESDCSWLRNRIVKLEEGLRQIAVWKQEDQDDHKTCILQWRGCVAIARELLKPNKEISQKEDRR